VRQAVAVRQDVVPQAIEDFAERTSQLRQRLREPRRQFRGRVRRRHAPVARSCVGEVRGDQPSKRGGGVGARFAFEVGQQLWE